jgi:transposase
MSNNMDSQLLAAIIRQLRRFSYDLRPRSEQLERQTGLARSIIRSLDQTALLQRATRVDEVFIISQLQDFAYYDADSGAIRDIAEWCARQWLRLLQQYPEDVDVLQGLCCMTPSTI